MTELRVLNTEEIEQEVSPDAPEYDFETWDYEKHFMKAQFHATIKEFIEWLKDEQIDYKKSDDKYYYCIEGSKIEAIKQLVEKKWKNALGARVIKL